MRWYWFSCPRLTVSFDALGLSQEPRIERLVIIVLFLMLPSTSGFVYILSVSAANGIEGAFNTGRHAAPLAKCSAGSNLCEATNQWCAIRR